MLEEIEEQVGLSGFISLVRDYYDESHRAYHNWSHIVHGASIIGHEHGFDRVLFLAWVCHDLVYVPSCPSNELNSVTLMTLLLRRYYPDFYLHHKNEILTAGNYIAATKDHDLSDPSDERLAIMLDADMAYLMSTPDFFNQSRDNIRKEFLLYADEDFQKGSRAFFTALLEKPKLFHSAVFIKAEADSQARKNIRGALL
jgi:predicted metal-dependent HD superfamily phosphohydrolase